MSTVFFNHKPDQKSNDEAKRLYSCLCSTLIITTHKDILQSELGINRLCLLSLMPAAAVNLCSLNKVKFKVLSLQIP